MNNINLTDITNIDVCNECRRYFLKPTKIISSRGLANPSALLESNCDQASQAVTGIELTNTTDGPASVVLDFGREICGGIKIITGKSHGGEPFKVRVSFGESVSEAMNSDRNDHAIRNEVITLPWLGERFIGETGFRFVKIELADSDNPATIASVQAYASLRNIEYRGSFECSDKQLNRIWQVGAETVHLCMQNYIWDGIKRDRLVWIGDIHPETSVVSTVFGKHSSVEKSLDFARDETPLPNFMNNMTPYSMWWIITHHDWYMSHGDIEYLREQEEYLVNLLDALGNMVDKETGKEQVTVGRFLDWITHGQEDAIHTGLQGLIIWALTAGANLCQALDRTEAAQKAQQIAALAKSYKVPQSSRKSPAAIATIAGLVDPQQNNTDVLGNEPLSDLTTFYGYYVLQARAAAGDIDGCLDVIRKYWGGMLSLGATSFWEHFDMSWLENAGRIDEIPTADKVDVHKTYGDHCYKGYRHSLCHGWAAGPTAWLSEHVLGISPASPGYEKVSIKPNLGNLDWARGTMPTPHGLITVEHKKDSNGKIKSSFLLPYGISAI